MYTAHPCKINFLHNSWKGISFVFVTYSVLQSTLESPKTRIPQRDWDLDTDSKSLSPSLRGHNMQTDIIPFTGARQRYRKKEEWLEVMPGGSHQGD